MTSLLGWSVTILFSICYFPQLYKTFRLKSVEEVSGLLWFFQAIGYVAGVGYGLEIHQIPLIVGYGFGLLCTLVFLGMYWRYRK